ncbi:MAG: hypothetical protein FJ009_07020 [Chloroflexi bacterium]|nr:hypothetical protein [Chloroflexota bacterium]
MFLLGLDVGTTSCKAAIFDERGNLVTKASREYAVAMPQPSWAEQDAERVWVLAQEAMREATMNARIRNVVALGLSVQGEAVIPVDAQGNALYSAILGMDRRTGEQNAWLREKFGNEYLFQHTGMPIHTINTLPKLLWLKQKEPDIWKNASRFMLYEDYLINKMSRHTVVSHCLASRTQLFDLQNELWSPEILQAIELDETRFSTVQPSGRVVGKMLPEVAERIGFSNRPLVVTGGHDQACGALGVGLTRAGLAMVSTGTAEVVEVALAAPALTPALERGNISVYSHVIPGLYLAMTLNHSGGLILRWFRDTFGREEMAQAEAQGRDAYDWMFRGVSAEPSRLMLLPHFAGSGTPHFDTESKGALLGLTFSTSKSDVAKAIIEGLTFELRVNLDLLKEGGVTISDLRAIGGGAKSELWLQLKADITGHRVTAPRIAEAACWGAALLAGVGAGLIPDVERAAESAQNLERTFNPDAERKKHYDTRYGIYRQLYPSLATILHQL